MQTSQQNIFGEILFTYTRRSSWEFSKSCLEQPFCREPISACFKEIPQQTLSQEFSTCKAGGCNLKACNYYKGISLQKFY